ncbi:MAG: membrane protein insertase YidC [Actinomycetes bacterium]
MGILDPLFEAVAWIIIQLHALLTDAGLDPDGGLTWALSISILVIFVRILLIPLFVKQIHSMRAMQTLQPQMQEIRKKYKDDRQRQSQEMMKLYQEHGTTPLSGCLPIIVQAPFFIALFQVLYAVGNDEVKYGFTRDLVDSAANASIFGAPIASRFLDPAGGDPTTVKIVTGLMIALMTFTTFITQKQVMAKNTAVTGDNPFAAQQKIMLYVFPAMFAVFGINFPVGVLIYWLTTNVWSMGQQFYVIHHMPAPGTPAAKAKADRQARKKAKRRGAPDVVDGVDGTDGAEASGSAERVKPKPVRQQPVKQSRSKRSGPRKR